MNYSKLVMCLFYCYISSTKHLLLRNTNFTLFDFDFKSKFQFKDLEQLVEEPLLIIELGCSQSITISAMEFADLRIVYFILLLATIFKCYLFID